MEIENLFMNYRETPWEKFKGWLYEEMSPFWSNWWHVRRGFMYSVWAVFLIAYLDEFAFNLWYGEYVIASVRFTMIVWFSLWCSEAHENLRIRKVLARTLDSWAETIQHVGRLEQDNSKMREELKQYRS